MEMREQINIVITGHVDHGKSTVMGRLLADTQSLPDGKLESIRAYCEKNSRVFEYAFLLDALKEEQSQGITIDAARIFFKTPKRDYLILDAPGHMEFLKNMITGAAKAEAAFIVIDAAEGIQDNSKRHGYLISMLGIRETAVLVNKMDLIGYDQTAFQGIVNEYAEFLGKIDVRPRYFIPISAREGGNLAQRSDAMEWYGGPTVVEAADRFVKPESLDALPFRFPVQDVYKFTQSGDDRRILAGLVVSGRIRTGDEVVFHPSGKNSRIRSVEVFGHVGTGSAVPGESTGFTLDHPLYIKPGEVMSRKIENRPPRVGRKFAANIFWMGNSPMVKEKQYIAKCGTARILIQLRDILGIIDATDLTTERNKTLIDRFDVAECVFEAVKPFGYDLAVDLEPTGRFVIIDQFEICGAGIILHGMDDDRTLEWDAVREREENWDTGYFPKAEREIRNKHKSKFIVIIGTTDGSEAHVGKHLEKRLFDAGLSAYYLGLRSLSAGLDRDLDGSLFGREESIRRLGEIARIMTDTGLIFISSAPELDDFDIVKLRTLNAPNEILVVRIGGTENDSARADLVIDSKQGIENSCDGIISKLRCLDILTEYCI